MAVILALDVRRRFEAVKPGMELLVSGVLHPAGGGCYAHVNVLVDDRRSPRRDRFIVWEMVLPDDAPDFCHSGFYTDDLRAALADFDKREGG